MARNPASRRAQRGMALLVFLTVLVVGSAWFTIGALAKAAPSAASREMRTGEALQAAKRALLGYAAQYAARTDHNVPGRLPCPESPASIGTSNEGEAPGACSNLTAEIGRLPWKTLGVDRIVDGAGEPLWYVLSPGFRQSPVNFDSSGQLTLDSALNAAVALIIAPGAALDTQLDADTPPAGCAKRNQGGNRGAAPLNALDFVECGNATGSYVTAGTSKWLNDRVLAVTAAEWADAIAGAVADRLQRQVAPALDQWRTTESVANWGIGFLPYGSTFSDPATNILCGSYGVREGLPPTSPASTACTAWSGSVSSLLGLTSSGCTQTGTELQCSFTSILGAAFSARITATAQQVAGSFRRPIASSDVTVSGGGWVQTFTLALSPSTGNATATMDIMFPLLPLTSSVSVRIPNLPDGAVLSDTRMAWFVNNNWDRLTYYAISSTATISPSGICTAPGDAGCLEIRGLPAENGNYWDKRLVLALTGLPIAGQNRSCPTGCNDLAQFLEIENASTPANRIYRADVRIPIPTALPPPYPPFNDRIATCPFQVMPSSGAVTLCN